MPRIRAGVHELIHVNAQNTSITLKLSLCILFSLSHANATALHPYGGPPHMQPSRGARINCTDAGTDS